MQFRKYRWSPTYEPSEFELIRLLESRRIDAKAWTVEAGAVIEPHQHDHDKRLWCAEGSIIYIIDGKPLSLQAGDAVELPAGTVHSATAGLTGCTCYQTPPATEHPSPSA